MADLGPCKVCRAPAVARCSRCQSAVYCSPDCQRSDWTAHKGRCKAEVREVPAPVPRSSPATSHVMPQQKEIEWDAVRAMLGQASTSPADNNADRAAGPSAASRWQSAPSQPTMPAPHDVCLVGHRSIETAQVVVDKLKALSLTASQKAPGCYLRDARFLLGPLERVTNPIQTVFDFFECQQLCEKTAGCTHFVYFGGSLFCNLGAGNLGVVEERGAVSGPAKCLEKESLACTGLPAGEFPAATPEASQRAWSTNYTPTRLQCWPLNSYSQPAYCRPHPVVSLENSSMGQCGDLQLVTPPEGQSCAQNCAGNVLCSTWQLREEGRCYQGLGIDCNAQLAVRDAGRLQHGLYRVIANLTGVQLSGLSPGHVGNGSQAVTRCRDLCLSLLACQAWQYSSTFGCYIDNPFVAPMPYPPVSQKETDFAKTAIAGQYVQRLCPEFVSRARGDSHDPDVVQQRNLPPVVAEIAEVSAPVLVAKPGTVAQAEEVATAKPTQLTTPAADVLPATLTVAPLLPAGVAVGTASSAAAATGTAASTPAAGMPAGSVAGTAASVPAGMAAGTAASTPGGMPASTPAGTAAGSAAGMPAGSAASTPAGTAAGAASTPAGTAAGSAAGMPAGSAASTPAGTAAGRQQARHQAR
ncbi:unnamed protein product [Effrenium voratum]|uniref:MYND-type domain-containing protein n=1 Tax=Effrenium voratum TaxID=2562239 RepID=A0AA36NHZ1_9DINO|nr:unnamed protein product [Effrenium voratum]